MPYGFPFACSLPACAYPTPAPTPEPTLPPTSTPMPELTLPPAPTPMPAPTTQELKVHFIDVGQGDSILIDSETTEILIDGGDKSPGVVAYLSNYVDGALEVTKGLRQMPAFNRIPIIAVTAHAMKGDEEKIIEAGCDTYLPKPINTHQLPKVVAEMLQQWQKDSVSQPGEW